MHGLARLAPNPAICRRADLTMTAVVFGGLLIAASALCAIDSTPAAFGPGEIDEVKVAVDQPTEPAHDSNQPVAMCKSHPNDATGLSRCHKAELH